MIFLTAQGGFLGPFAWFFGKIFNFIYNLLANDQGIANLGICIILFTVVVKLILFPLTFNQQKSTKINSFIQPEISKIQKKYKDKKDQASMMKQQKEVQEVYDKYGTSMTNGCLPLLIQLPFLYALYAVIRNVPAYVDKVKEMYTPIAQGVIDAKGTGKEMINFFTNFTDTNNIVNASTVVKQLSKSLTNGNTIGMNNVIDVISKFDVNSLNQLADTLKMNVTQSINSIEKVNSFFLGINVLEAPGYKLSWALIIPVATALFQYLSMKVTSTNQNTQGDNMAQSMKSMQIIMPLFTGFLCITLPVYIGIYWAFSALISMITQLGVNFYYDHTNMDEILEKQMEKAAEKKKKNGGKKSFMQRMMEQSQEQQEQMEKKEAMRKNSSKSLKSYVPSEEAKNAVEAKSNKQYKSGSIGAKANIMLQYNNSEKKED